MITINKILLKPFILYRRGQGGFKQHPWPQLSSYASRSAAVASVLSELRVAGVSAALRTWRGENFDVWGRGLGAPLLEVERSAMGELHMLHSRNFKNRARLVIVQCQGGSRGPNEIRAR